MYTDKEVVQMEVKGAGEAGREPRGGVTPPWTEEGHCSDVEGRPLPWKEHGG